VDNGVVRVGIVLGTVIDGAYIVHIHIAAVAQMRGGRRQVVEVSVECVLSEEDRTGQDFQVADHNIPE